MKDEIKRKIKGYVYNEDDEKKILDYITNLQEENVVLKSQLLQDNKSYYDMKDRIKKAIEYIKKHCDYGYAGQKCLTDVLYRYEAEELLEILQGKSDE